jgi:lipopolysaccharide/colanic/teichoic acid biosynthesis glycosyltransferase
MPRKLALAASYADGASLGQDLRILWRTLRLLIGAR